jgi:hypothetical protein
MPMNARRWASAAVIGLACAFVPSPLGAGEPCKADCLVQFGALRGEYARKARVEVSLRNASANKLMVFVVLDQLIDGVWRETPFTVSDPDHGFKIVTLSPIEPHGALVFSFPACASLKIISQGGGGRDVLVPCPDSAPSPPSLQRLHAYVVLSGQSPHEVVSAPYRVLPK